MKLGARARLFLLVVAFIAASVATADAFMTTVMANHLSSTIESDMVVRTRLVAREAADTAAPLDDDNPAWESLAAALAPPADARVTFIRRDGVVIGDSHVPLAEVARMDNHAGRPEVRDALATGQGQATRMSTTMQQPMLYTAVPFTRDGSIAGVARLAKPLREVDLTNGELRRLFWFVAAIAFGLALALSSVATKRMSVAIQELILATRRMRDGDLSVRTRLPGHDELAELGHSLDTLAANVGTTLGDLRAERDLQKRILEAMHEGVVVVDGKGRIVLVNPALRAMLLLGADAVGRLLIETVRHAQLHTLLEGARAEQNGSPVEIELPGLKPRRLLVHAAPLSGGEDRLLFVFVDVTELRRLESLRREFVANASHELRTPIAAVRSATETLRFGAIDDRGAAIRFMDIIERNAQRLQSLVEDMLELSKLEANEFKVKRERVELQRVVPIVLGLFRERADKKGVRLTAELPATLAAVEGDPRALEHVLSNLVDNAVKYCPSGARIVVTASEEEGRVRLVVADTGPGIAPEHLPRVFERFYRVDAGRSRELGGTGLGLSIVKHMVEAMRGRVSVESTVGKGSTFAVSLHRADGQTEIAAT